MHTLCPWHNSVREQSHQAAGAPLPPRNMNIVGFFNNFWGFCGSPSPLRGAWEERMRPGAGRRWCRGERVCLGWARLCQGLRKELWHQLSEERLLQRPRQRGQGQELVRRAGRKSEKGREKGEGKNLKRPDATRATARPRASRTLKPSHRAFRSEDWKQRGRFLVILTAKSPLLSWPPYLLQFSLSLFFFYFLR